jgi:hypothetical protein
MGVVICAPIDAAAAPAAWDVLAAQRGVGHKRVTATATRRMILHLSCIAEFEPQTHGDAGKSAIDAPQA